MVLEDTKLTGASHLAEEMRQAVGLLNSPLQKTDLAQLRL